MRVTSMTSGTWYEDDEVFEEEEDDEVPEALEEAMDHADEAYVSNVESRKRAQELALSRGFYPIAAIGPEASQNEKEKVKVEAS